MEIIDTEKSDLFLFQKCLFLEEKLEYFLIFYEFSLSTVQIIMYATCKHTCVRKGQSMREQ